MAGALALIGAVALAAAPSAQGALPGPVGALGGAIDAGLGAVTGGFGGLAVEGFGGIVKALFAWPAKLVNRELLAWLVAVPDYAIPASSGPAGRRGGELAELAGTTQTMAFAALGAVGTVAGVRYWAAGLTGSGGLEALEGLARTVAAALAIVAWPWLFRHGAELANAAGRGLLGSERVLEDTARMLASAFAAAVAFNVLAILVALAAAVLLLMLLVAKIAVSAGTALVFVGMPLALLLWPLPELAWVARAALRMFGIVLAIPLAWAVSFATFAAVGVDALAFDGAGGVGDKLLTPLVALALLWLTATLPRSLMRAAMSGVGSASGTVSRTSSRVVARQIDGALASGTRPGVSAAGQPARAVTGGGSSAAAEGAASAGAARAGGAGAAGAAATAASGGAAAVAAGAAGRGGGWRAPIDVPAPDTAERSGGGLPRPSWQEIRERVPLELDAAARRQAATTPRDVLLALRALPPTVARDIQALLTERDGQIRGQMAHQAARSELSDEHREAFRTLAAASPADRKEGAAAYAAAVEPLPERQEPESPPPPTPAVEPPRSATAPLVPADGPAGAPASPTSSGDGAASPPSRDPLDGTRR